MTHNIVDLCIGNCPAKRAMMFAVAVLASTAWTPVVSAAPFPAVVKLSSLDGSTGFRLQGAAKYQGKSGRSVASAGDINGDGFDDVIVGAYREKAANKRSSGATNVVFGKASGFAANLNLSTLDGTNGFRVRGVSGYDYSGYSVAGAGDVNGDGFADLIIGARGADPGGRSEAGSTYVVFGKASGFAPLLALSSLDGSNGFRIDGGYAFDRSAFSVAGAGDVNGDGFADVIIGAPLADPRLRFEAGSTYVVFGKSSGFAPRLNLKSLDGTDGFRLDGVSGNDQIGRSVAGAGDVNGDGFDDVIVGAPFIEPRGTREAGSTYVVFGKASGFTPKLNLKTLDGSNGFRIDGASYNAQSGYSVASVGDVNGDGFADVIIGAPFADPGPGLLTGSTYVVFGKASGFTPKLNLKSLDGTNGFRLDGVTTFDRSGRSVAGAGDINGDGFDDVIVGAPFAEPGGESFAVFGKASGFGPTLKLSSLHGSTGFRLDGALAAVLSPAPAMSMATGLPI